MATFFHVSNPLAHPFSFSLGSPLPFFRPPPFPIPPPLRVAAGDRCRRKPRGSMVAARAGPSTSSIAFAIALPLSLLAVTVFTSIRIADKLDQQFYEEMALNEAIMQADEDDDDKDDDNDVNDNDDDDAETYAQEEPALPRARNRPKREA